jgi:hypothetical protein
MATRHFYMKDTVCATLLHALQTGDSDQAIYAARELWESQESELLKATLTLAWLLAPPDHPNESNRYAAFARDDVKEFLFTLLDAPYTLPELPEHVVIPTPIPRPYANSVGAWTILPLEYTYDQACKFYRAVDISLQNGFWEHAAYLAVSLLPTSPSSVSSLLSAFGVSPRLIELLDGTLFEPLRYRIVEHALAGVGWGLKPIPMDLKPAERAWNRPPAAHLAMSATACAIWQVRAPPASQLRGAPMLILAPAATEFWKRAVATYGITADSEANCLKFRDDAAEDAFYVECFQDDLPDEWTDARVNRSHGFTVPHTTDKNVWYAAFALLF